jgi:hypothetical protein
LIRVAVFPVRQIEFAEERQATAKQMTHNSITWDAEFLSGILIAQTLHADQHDSGTFLDGQSINLLAYLHRRGLRTRCSQHNLA